MGEQHRLLNMDRRDFLKVMTQISTTGLAAAILANLPARAAPDASLAPIQTEALGRKFRGTSDGRIFESRDGGRTWQLIANFGKHCAILTLLEHQDQVYAQIGVQGYSFLVRSSNARLWYTTS